MANPNQPQGTLNRLKASVVVASSPELNVTPAFLGRQMILLTPEGDITTMMPTATGVVTSPEPFQKVTVSIHLLKTQSLSAQYKARLESNSLLGDITVWPDVQTGQGLTNYPLSNCAIQNVSPMKFDGTDPEWMLTLSGIYFVNNSLWL